METIKNTLRVKTSLPNKEFDRWDYSSNTYISVTTEFNPNTNNFSFKSKIPDYIYDFVKEDFKDRECTWFKRNIIKSNLDLLLSEFSDVCGRAIELKQREKLETEKYLAVKFVDYHSAQIDEFNHGSMGFKTTSAFQFFIVFKDLLSSGSMERYKFKTDKKGFGLDNFNKDRHWHYFGSSIIEKGGWKLIKWTQDREDYLKIIQDKFVEINVRLNTFLGNLDEDTIEKLMESNFLLLN